MIDPVLVEYEIGVRRNAIRIERGIIRELLDSLVEIADEDAYYEDMLDFSAEIADIAEELEYSARHVAEMQDYIRRMSDESR